MSHIDQQLRGSDHHNGGDMIGGDAFDEFKDDRDAKRKYLKKKHWNLNL